MFNKKLFLYNVFFGQFCSYLRSTRHKCTWALKVFDEWFSEKLNSDGLFKDIEGDLLKFSDDELVYVFTCFILEVKKQNGEDYPAETLYELVIYLQLFINGRKLKLLDDEKFVNVCNCLDNRMKDLSREGNVHPRNEAVPITLEQENDMWSHNILGGSNPK